MLKLSIPDWFYTQEESEKSFQKGKIKRYRMSTVNHSNLTVQHPQFNAVLWVTPPGLYKRRETWEFGCDLRSYREQLRKNAVFEFTSSSTTRDATEVLTRCNNLHEMYEQCKHQTTVCWTSLMGLDFLRVDRCCNFTLLLQVFI